MVSSANIFFVQSKETQAITLYRPHASADGLARCLYYPLIASGTKESTPCNKNRSTKQIEYDRTEQH